MIRRLLGLGLVLVLAVIVQRAAPGAAPLGAAITLGLGFALIAAVLTAELVERVSLPRVTGYLLLGLLCGPYLGNLITTTMASELQVVNGLAVSLIAFIAGLEINIARLRTRLGVVVALGVTTLAVMYVVLVPALYFAWPWLPIAPSANGLARLAIVVVLAVVVISFSPTVTIAVIAENRARGPFSELVLAVVILADLALILCFTLAMQLAGFVLGTNEAGEAGLAIRLAWDIVGSFAFGAAVGAAFALYLRLVGREVTLALLALCAFITVVGTRLSFEPLLVALAAGLVVENIAPPRGDVLRESVERGALPVLVVFFAAAGASLHLDALAELWMVAVALSAARIGTARLGTLIGTRLSGVDPAHGGSAWMGLVSQAGVTLGLAIIVARQYPGWGAQLQTLVVALIAIHEVIGPVLFRAALARAGEIAVGDGEP